MKKTARNKQHTTYQEQVPVKTLGVLALGLTVASVFYIFGNVDHFKSMTWDDVLPGVSQEIAKIECAQQLQEASGINICITTFRDGFVHTEKINLPSTIYMKVNYNRGPKHIFVGDDMEFNNVHAESLKKFGSFSPFTVEFHPNTRYPFHTSTADFNLFKHPIGGAYKMDNHVQTKDFPQMQVALAKVSQSAVKARSLHAAKQ